MTPAGLFVSFEGIDGAGKSTHIEALARAFRASDRQVTLTREPGGTPLAEKIRQLALHESMDALTEALLMFAARRDHIACVIAPALARGEVVICDRFTDATFAYQGGGHGFSWQSLQQLEQMVQSLKGLPDSDTNHGTHRFDTCAPAVVSATLDSGQVLPEESDLAKEGLFLQPDLTLLFDLPSEVAATRLAASRTPDRFEAQPQDFFEAVRLAYARRQKADPGRFVRINANQTPGDVWQDVIQAIQNREWL